MAEVKRFLILDSNGNLTEQSDTMTLEVDAGSTARSVVNKSQLEGVVADEATARQTADTALGDSISTLQGLLADLSSSTSADFTLVNNRITQEIADRIVDVDNEETRALAAEALLQAAIDAEVTAREAAVTAEAAARDAADTALSGRLTIEEAARALLDTTLRGLISDEAAARALADTGLQNEIDAEEQARANEVTRLEGLITAEAGARGLADTALQTAIDNEVTARTNADTALQTDIDAEETRATAAEAALQAEIDAEETLRASEITRVEGLITAEATARAADVDAEEARASGVEATLTLGLANEVTRATGEEARIEGKFDAAIVAEAAARESGDTINAQAITDEATRATAAEGLLATNLSAEVSRAQAAETSLSTALDAEVARATAEEIAVENRAKAYADARVQGLKPKSSVDFALTQFVPNYIGENPGLQPKFRFREITPPPGVTDLVQWGEIPSEDASGSSPFIFYDGTSYGGNSGGLGYMGFVKYTTTGGVTTWEYGNPDSSYEGQSLSLKDALFSYNGMTGPWTEYMAAGWQEYYAALEVIDLSDPATLENYTVRLCQSSTSDGVGLNPSDMNSNMRIALVQNGVGNGDQWWATGSRTEVQNSTVTDNSNQYFLVRSDIQSLPLEEQIGASLMAFNQGVANTALGIYLRTVTTPATNDTLPVATIARAPDFAVGMDVSGAFVVTERGISGPFISSNVDGQAEAGGQYYYDVFARLDGARLTARNTGIIFNALDTNNSGVNAIVGTDPLLATLFSRVGTYDFDQYGGLSVNRQGGMATVSVKVDTHQSMQISSDGGLAINLANTSSPNSSGLEHRRLGGGNTGPTGLGLAGPLVGGEASDLEAQESDWLFDIQNPERRPVHHHRGLYMKTPTWPVQRDPDTNEITGFALSKGFAARMGSFDLGSAGGVQETFVPATWDTPDFLGVADKVQYVAEDSPATNYMGRICVSGTVHLNPSGNLDFSGFALNDVVYLGGTPGSYVKFGDVPAGKWAVPVGIYIGSDGVTMLTHRAPFLKPA